MREIKFRGYNFTKNKMILFEKIRPLDYVYDGTLDEMVYGMENHLRLMQYTGLKDENGVEIYEYMEIDNTYEVSFLNGSYVLTNISNGDIILLSNYMENNNGKVEITREYTKV